MAALPTRAWVGRRRGRVETNGPAAFMTGGMCGKVWRRGMATRHCTTRRSTRRSARHPHPAAAAPADLSVTHVPWRRACGPKRGAPATTVATTTADSSASRGRQDQCFSDAVEARMHPAHVHRKVPYMRPRIGAAGEDDDDADDDDGGGGDADNHDEEHR